MQFDTGSSDIPLRVPAPPIRADVEESLCRFIAQATGIVILDHQRSVLHDTLRGACKRFGYPTEEEFLECLLRHPTASPELEYLIGEITVGESYFFRDREQIAFLEDVWLPDIDDWHLHLIGTDIHSHSLCIATVGGHPP